MSEELFTTNKQVDTQWEWSFKLLGLGTSSDEITYELRNYDLVLDIKHIQLLFLRRTTVTTRRAKKKISSRTLIRE